jgi:drug/metabolite transporter (DMT)-like permease
MSPEVLAVTYGLGSAIVWGVGDFSGGVATRRNSVFAVILFSQLAGVALLAVLALAFKAALPPLSHLLLGALAGLCGFFGLVAFYQALARGRMGIVAPLSAVLAAAVPMAFAAWTQGLPEKLRLLGLGIAVLSIWLLACSGTADRIRPWELRLSIAAGLGFALFFILMDRAASHGSLLWPLVAARGASIALMAALCLARRQIEVPGARQFPVIVLAGLMDVGGNALFVLATQNGRLDISAALASLYPAATVFLAWGVLKEKILPLQWLGVGAAVVATVLIAA